MQYIYVLKYNNYYNRQIKVLNSLSDYLPYVTASITYQTNFNPADGVNTTFVMNMNDNYETSDYFLVVDDNDSSIVSRWFILDANRNKSGQYTLQLRRDLIADAISDLYDAPMFVEKATLQNDDPMIFNKENMTYNQIKKSETLIKDRSQCAWLVGFMARTDGSGTITAYNKTYTPSTAEYISLVTQSVSDFITNNTNNMKNIVSNTMRLDINYNYYGEAWNRTYMDSSTTAYDTGVATFIDSWALPGELRSQFNSNYLDFATIKETLRTSLGFETVTNVNNFINQYNGKKVKFADGNIYEINIKRNSLITSNNDEMPSSLPNVISALDTQVSNKIETVYGSTSYSKNGNPYKNFVYSYQTITITATIVSIEGTFNVNIPSTRKHLNDAPYDMFCMPLSDIIYGETLYTTRSLTNFKMTKDFALQVAQSISELGGTTFYDFQILPYCPMQSIIGRGDIFSNSVYLYNLTEHQDYELITDSDGNNRGVIFFPTESSFSLTILLGESIEVSNTKISNECDVYRLCSPNYQGVFEFSAAKNNGISSFNVDCTYKPFNPYIHVSPDFGGLYGEDFNDSRGLTCGGDFSLARVTDNWTNYELNNKNYQAVFNRQIENLDFNNNMAKTSETINAITGTLQGAYAGNIFGGATGALVGGALSAGAGITDVILNEKIRQENRQYTIDQFGYQLGNIKARPDSLSRTTAFSANNKYFPFLEYYTCTDEEKTALENKLKWNGMTVMRIGTLNEFLNDDESYIKGRLIRLTGNYDNHYINELSDELYKGIFIRKDLN